MVRVLLEHGADPTEDAGYGSTIWMAFLDRVLEKEHVCRDENIGIKYARVVQELLSSSLKVGGCSLQLSNEHYKLLESFAKGLSKNFPEEAATLLSSLEQWRSKMHGK
jgi:hypothetical protein